MKELGTKIKAARLKAILSPADVAAKAGYSVSTVQKIEGGKPGPSTAAIVAVAKVVGVSIDVEALLSGAALPLDNNLSGVPRDITVVEWPELHIAASHFVTIETLGEIMGEDEIQAAIRTGRFRVRVRGTCMEPKWMDGDLVEFDVLRGDADFVVGKDYYIESLDGATMKRCIFENEHVVAIACINGDRKEWRIKRKDITRAARAIGALIERPEA